MSNTPKKQYIAIEIFPYGSPGAWSEPQASLKQAFDVIAGEIEDEEAVLFFEVVPLKVEITKEVREVVSEVKAV